MRRWEQCVWRCRQRTVWVGRPPWAGRLRCPTRLLMHEVAVGASGLAVGIRTAATMRDESMRSREP